MQRLWLEAWGGHTTACSSKCVACFAVHKFLCVCCVLLNKGQFVRLIVGFLYVCIFSFGYREFGCQYCTIDGLEKTDLRSDLLYVSSLTQ